VKRRPTWEIFGKRSLCESTLIRDLCGELKVSLALLLEVNWLETLTGSIGEPFNRADEPAASRPVHRSSQER